MSEQSIQKVRKVIDEDIKAYHNLYENTLTLLLKPEGAYAIGAHLERLFAYLKLHGFSFDNRKHPLKLYTRKIISDNISELGRIEGEVRYDYKKYALTFKFSWFIGEEVSEFTMETPIENPVSNRLDFLYQLRDLDDYLNRFYSRLADHNGNGYELPF